MNVWYIWIDNNEEVITISSLECKQISDYRIMLENNIEITFENSIIKIQNDNDI